MYIYTYIHIYMQDNCTLVWLNELEVFHYQWLQILSFKDPQ